MEEKSVGLLFRYRVLDLYDEKGVVRGRILGDFGADVIKTERLGGDLCRYTRPFYHDIPDPEIIAEVSKNLGEAMPGLDIRQIPPEELLAPRGW